MIRTCFSLLFHIIICQRTGQMKFINRSIVDDERRVNNDELMPMKIMLMYARIQPASIKLFNDGLDMRMYLNNEQ
jgi:hypothetical protein